MPVLNPHALADKAFLAPARLRTGEAFSEGAVSPSFDEHLEAIRFDMPPLTDGGAHEFTVESAAGPMEAAYDVLLWADPSAPTVIWHHKGGEVPFDRIARQVFVTSERLIEANVITVRMPFHRSRKEFKSGLAYLSRFIAMMATAVQVTEELLQSPALGRSIHTMVAGYSLGGFVTNRHHLKYNSASSYVPFMAGTAQGEPWLSSLPVAAIARQRPDALRQSLNFQNEWAATEHPNVHPVLGRYDQVCRWDVQRPSYGTTRAAAWGVGHVTGWRSPARIRTKVLRHLFEPETAEAASQQSGTGARP